MKRTVYCNVVRKCCEGYKHRLLGKIHRWVSQRGFLEEVTLAQRILKEEYKPIQVVYKWHSRQKEQQMQNQELVTRARTSLGKSLVGT